MVFKDVWDVVDNIGVDCVCRSIFVFVICDLEGRIVMLRLMLFLLLIRELEGKLMLGMEDEVDKV